MARWDVYRNAARRGDTPYLLDVQADLLVHLRTRAVVPLRRAETVPAPMARLQPRVSVGGEDLVMDTPMIVGAPVSALGPRVGNLSAQSAELLAALDFLLAGI